MNAQITITVTEHSEQFAVFMAASGERRHTVGMVPVPFGTVLQEVSRFLDLNVR